MLRGALTRRLVRRDNQKSIDAWRVGSAIERLIYHTNRLQYRLVVVAVVAVVILIHSVKHSHDSWSSQKEFLVVVIFFYHVYASYQSARYQTLRDIFSIESSGWVEAMVRVEKIQSTTKVDCIFFNHVFFHKILQHFVFIEPTFQIHLSRMTRWLWNIRHEGYSINKSQRPLNNARPDKN